MCGRSSEITMKDLLRKRAKEWPEAWASICRCLPKPWSTCRKMTAPNWTCSPNRMRNANDEARLIQSRRLQRGRDWSFVHSFVIRHSSLVRCLSQFRSRSHQNKTVVLLGSGSNRPLADRTRSMLRISAVTLARSHLAYDKNGSGPARL